jgi:rod shape-determining protein MreD
MSKRTTVIFIFLTIGSILAQVSFLNRFVFFGIKPDLILALVVFFSLFFEPGKAFWVVLLAGAACDIFSGGPFGLNIFVYFCIFFAVQINKRIINTQNSWSLLLVTFTIFLLSYIIYYLTARVSLELPGFYVTFKMLIIPAALYALIPFYIIYFVFAKPLRLI